MRVETGKDGLEILPESRGGQGGNGTRQNMKAMKVQTDIVLVDCCNCGSFVALTKLQEEPFRENHQKFFCPLGHTLLWPQETEAEGLRKALAKAQANLRSAKEEKCPACHRHIANKNLASHMASKHPGGKEQVPCL